MGGIYIMNLNLLEEIKKQEIDIATSSSSPTCIFLGGQPGSGKTKLIDCIKKDYPQKNFAIIDADNYRKFHPNKEFFLKDAPTATLKTSEFANELEFALLKYAIEKQKDIIHVSTLRATELMLKIMHRMVLPYHYTIQIYALSVPLIESTLCSEERYEEQLLDTNDIPRFTNFNFIQSADEGFLKTIRLLEKDSQIDTICIYQRGKTPSSLPKQIYDSKENITYSSAVEAILTNRQLQERELSSENILKRIELLYDKRKQRNASEAEFSSLDQVYEFFKFSEKTSNLER